MFVFLQNWTFKKLIKNFPKSSCFITLKIIYIVLCDIVTKNVLKIERVLFLWLFKLSDCLYHHHTATLKSVFQMQLLTAFRFKIIMHDCFI